MLWVSSAHWVHPRMHKVGGSSRVKACCMGSERQSRSNELLPRGWRQVAQHGDAHTCYVSSLLVQTRT